MALAVTSLVGNIGMNDRQVRLTAFTNPQVGRIGPDVMLLVDGEAMRMTDGTLSPVLSVTRGDSIGPPQPQLIASAHNALAPVVYGLTSDFTQSISTTGTAGVAVYSFSVNNTNVTLPVVDAKIYLTKATALAITINGPLSDQVNTIVFESLTAAAHTVTYTAGFSGNTTSSDVATFAATVGAAMTIQAKNGVWTVLSSTGVTVA